MEIKIEFLNDGFTLDGGRESDKLIRAIDRAMGGANWESADSATAGIAGNSWIARN